MTPDKAERVFLSQTNARATLQPLDRDVVKHENDKYSDIVTISAAVS